MEGDFPNADAQQIAITSHCLRHLLGRVHACSLDGWRKGHESDDAKQLRRLCAERLLRRRPRNDKTLRRACLQPQVVVRSGRHRPTAPPNSGSTSRHPGDFQLDEVQMRQSLFARFGQRGATGLHRSGKPQTLARTLHPRERPARPSQSLRLGTESGRRTFPGRRQPGGQIRRDGRHLYSSDRRFVPHFQRWRGRTGLAVGLSAFHHHAASAAIWQQLRHVGLNHAPRPHGDLDSAQSRTGNQATTSH